MAERDPHTTHKPDQVRAALNAVNRVNGGGGPKDALRTMIQECSKCKGCLGFDILVNRPVYESSVVCAINAFRDVSVPHGHLPSDGPICTEFTRKA